MQKRTPFTGTLALWDKQGFWVQGKPLAEKRFPPCSTFKLTLGLIGLETGILPNASTLWRWDKTPSSRKSEQRDLTLKTALAESSEWYFRALARKIGAQELRRWVTRLSYGSGWKGNAVADAWHDGSLLISPHEQAELMWRLAQSNLPFKPDVQATIRECSAFPAKGSTLWGKTGTGDKIAWYIGAATHQGETVAFAAFQQGKGVLGPKVREQLAALVEQRGLFRQ